MSTLPKEQSSNPNEPIDDSTVMIYGEVVTVKPIPTRQVTQIIVEIPTEHHIAATQMLFGRNAFIMPCADKMPIPGVPYGVTTLGKVLNPPEPENDAGLPSPSSRSINVTQWLAVRSKDPNFQAFLNVANESEAAVKVRTICNVASRGEIAHDATAYEIFLTQIYKPFNEKYPTVRRFFQDNNWRRNPG